MSKTPTPKFSVDLDDLESITETFTFVDPSHGPVSTYSIITTAFINQPASGSKVCVVVGLASIDPSDRATRRLGLASYCRLLDQRIPRAVHHIGIESNYAGESMALLIYGQMSPFLARPREWLDPDAVHQRQEQKRLLDQGEDGGRVRHGLATTRSIQLLGTTLLNQKMDRGHVRIANQVFIFGGPNLMADLQAQLAEMLRVGPRSLPLVSLLAWKWKHDAFTVR